MTASLPRLATLVLALAGTLATPVVTRADERPVQYVVMTILPDGTVQPVFAAPVVVHRNADTQRPTVPAAPARDRTALTLQMRDANGRVVFEDTQQMPTWLRSETPGADTTAIDAHLIAEPARTFVTRLPIVPGARLSLRSELVPGAAEVRLDGLAAGAAAALAAPDVVSLKHTGDPGNRLDMLILGDGYTSGEREKFETDAAHIAAGFFDLTPLREYRNYANVSTLFIPSNQSGADQPRFDSTCTEYFRTQTCCGDNTAFGELAVAVDTAFDATFCSFNIQRAITVDNAKVFTAAAALPDWDMLVVLVNSATYGGTGGPLSTVSVSGFETGVTQHEYGHSFGRLADEYADPFPGYPPCSDIDTAISPCEPNVTDQTVRSSIKWQRWIASTQPIPSIDPPAVETAAGLWQGARYLGTGMYRQGYACKMAVNDAPFCDVASETLVLRFYQGSWGTPAEGIDNIEPGSESPPAGTVTLPDSGGSFSATLLGPEDGPALDTQWLVDGVVAATAPVVNGARASFTLTAPPGLHMLELRVTDMSPLIHDTVRQSFSSLRTWTVSIGPNGSSICGDADGNGNVTVSDGVQTLRAAAGLASLCVPSRCDVDGSGGVSLTDGVNVLRAAAGLPVATACPAAAD